MALEHSDRKVTLKIRSMRKLRLQGKFKED
jgi:hypothetical protein